MYLVKSGITIKVLRLAATCFVLSSTIAFAQTIDEITVTAQKRQENSQEVPISINVMDGAVMERLNVRQAIDLANYTPGLQTVFAASESAPVFAIRGVGLDDFNLNNSSGVGVYTDGVFAPSQIFLTAPMFDVERIEVLKGPQGTLYGRNATAGAINVISRKPTADKNGYVRIGYGRWESLRVEGAIGGELTPNVNGRVALIHGKDGDGWQTDIDNGRSYGARDFTAVRAQLDFSPTNNSDVTVAVRYLRDDSQPQSPTLQGSEEGAEGISTGSLGFDAIPGVLDFFGVPVEGLIDTPTDPALVRSNIIPSRDDDFFGATITANIDFGSTTLTSITSWDNGEHSRVENTDGCNCTGADFRTTAEAKQYSQEFRLTSDDSGRFNWIIGASFGHDEIDEIATFDFTDAFGFTADDFFTPLPGLGQINAGVVQVDYVQKSDSFGAFISTDTHLTDNLDLTVGLRYSYDDRSWVGSLTDVFGGITSFRQFDPFTAVDSSLLNINNVGAFAGSSIGGDNFSNSENSLDFRVALNYAISDSAIVFGSISSGYRAGIYYSSPALSAISLGYIAPEEIIAYEIGFKSNPRDNFQLNGSVYYMDYTDRQTLLVGDSTPANPNDNFFFLTLGTVPEAEVSGVELDMIWYPIDGLELVAGYAYLNAEVESPPQTVRGLPVVSPINSGDSLPMSPENSFSLIAAYEWPVSDGLNMRIQADYVAYDERVGALGDPTSATGEDFDEVGARITIGNTDEDWLLSVYGKNLADNQTDLVSYLDSFLGRTVYQQRPMTWGVTFEYKFD